MKFGRLFLLKDIKIDKDYINICDQSGESFRAWIKANAQWTGEEGNGFSYLNENDKIYVHAPMNICYTSNYLMIENPRNYYKSFLAFITKVTYINEGTTEISFVIDEIRTWWDNVVPQPCLVEREHVLEDTLGAYTLPEPFPMSSEWKRIGLQFENFSDFNYMIAQTKDNMNEEDFKTINNVLVGVDITDTPITAAEVAKRLYFVISEGKEQNIVDVYAVPTSNKTSMVYIMLKSLDGGFTPRYNKMYTAQFNKCVLSDLCGNSSELHFERSSVKDRIGVVIEKTLVPTCIINVAPTGYNGFEYDYTNAISLNDFPKVIWQGDAYKQWLANNDVANGLKMGTQALSFLGGFATMAAALAGLTNPATAIPTAIMGSVTAASSLISTGQLLNEYDTAQLQPHNVYGTTNSTISLVSQNRYGIYLMQFSQPREYLEIQDQYFHLSGYRIDTVKVPNLQTPGRKFNYVKTKNCAFTGDCPASTLQLINAVFNRGVTIWHNVATMLEYD